MDTLPADSTPLPAHLNAWAADVWTVLSALDGLTLALIGVGVYGGSLALLAVDRRQWPLLRALLKAVLAVLAGGGMIAVGGWLHGSDYAPLGGLGARWLSEAALLPAGSGRVVGRLLGFLAYGAEGLLVLAILIGAGVAAVVALWFLPGLVLNLLTLPFTALGSLVGGGLGMIGDWLQRLLGGARGGSPPVPPEPAPPAPDPPVPEPAPPPPPAPSLVDRWMTALFGESAADHERRAVLYAARRKEYEEQKAAWEAHYHLTQTGTLQSLDYQRKKEEAQRLLTREQKEHTQEQKAHDRAGLEDEYERAKLQAGIHRLSLTTTPPPTPTVEAEVQRIKAIIERGERKEAALSELNRWKRERFAELDAAVVRGELTEGEAEDRKELIENLIRQETRG